MVKRINTKISKTNHERLKNFSDGSIDKNLNLLLDIVKDKMPFVNYTDTMVSVNLYSDTCERLDGYHITFSESRDNIITRLFIAYDELNGVEDVEIPFKLTSPLNSELVLVGVYSSLNGIAITSDCNTFEYNAWIKLLDWEEIKQIILKHSNEQVSFSKPLYKIEVNI